MFRFLLRYSGLMCSVFATGFVVLGCFVGTCLFSSVVIPIEVLFALKICAGGTLCTGLCYIGRIDGLHCGREIEQERHENSNRRVSDLDFMSTERVDIDNNALLLKKEVNRSKEDQEQAIFRAQIESLTRRVSDLEGQQAARFHSEARREIHHERMLYGRQFETDSDSDGESKSNLVTQGVFARGTIQERRTASNDLSDLGVEIIHRNNTRN